MGGEAAQVAVGDEAFAIADGGAGGLHGVSSDGEVPGQLRRRRLFSRTN
jgi:hypothetical protein